MTLRCVALAGALWAGAVLAADAPREMHGSADAFAAPGVALAWGIARGANEAATVVVVRLAVDPKRYPAIAVAGIDPFTKAEKSIFAAAATDGPVDVRIPRAQFADFPGTQFRLYATPSPGPAAAPALVVFYHGVPDTTPEFTDAAKLDAHLAARLVQARATGKPP